MFWRAPLLISEILSGMECNQLKIFNMSTEIIYHVDIEEEEKTNNFV